MINLSCYVVAHHPVGLLAAASVYTDLHESMKVPKNILFSLRHFLCVLLCSEAFIEDVSICCSISSHVNRAR